MTLGTVIALAFAIVFNSGSQLLFKSLSTDPGTRWDWSVLADARLLGGVASQGLAALFWFRVLSRASLTSALPILTGGIFVLVAIAAVPLFDERLGSGKVFGILLVFAGIALLAQR